ncbi:hypothetical protein [Streptomyces sp. B6B3]|uniref:hypothetical protein n=1 Tax=Streptomyces sp. B6B3 TaxID=3153570 RepID=UPI00325CA90C
MGASNTVTTTTTRTEQVTALRALRALEERLLRGRRETALRNAWAAVQEDRERAAARFEAERSLRAL